MGKDKEEDSFALGEKLFPQRFPLPSSGTSCALEWRASSFSWVGERAPYATPQGARGNSGPGSPQTKRREGWDLRSIRGLYVQIPLPA